MAQWSEELIFQLFKPIDLYDSNFCIYLSEEVALIAVMQMLKMDNSLILECAWGAVAVNSGMYICKLESQQHVD